MVVRGTARGKVGERVDLLQENRSVYTPLGEDDITRLEDVYAEV